ncbi:hypothetical protein UPYG_G00023010 [Umbra pygmaea]|uniref:Ig-like domain-containing protein n=1 Tax=Umbra pygmaea TaxID=75934 RepID=A0ABD0XPA2_UMBPY
MNDKKKVLSTRCRTDASDEEKIGEKTNEIKLGNTMSWRLQLAVLVLHSFTSLSSASPETCKLTGSSITVPLSYKASENDEINWKHNDIVIFKRKNQKYKPGKKEDISSDGSLILNNLTISNGGTYIGEVFSDGKSLRKTTVSVCVEEKKPKGTFKCSSLNVTMTCTVTRTNTVSFSWMKNGKLIVGKTETLTILLKDLKESDTFTCSVANKASKETSDIIKPTCKGSSDSRFADKLFGFDFWTMVGILAGGGGLVVILIIVTLVCCCHSRHQTRRRCEEEGEMRLVPLTQPQYPCHPDGQKQKQRPHEVAAPGSTGPRHAPQARERPPQTPRDDDDEQPPPLPQPRKKRPRPPKQ